MQTIYNQLLQDLGSHENVDAAIDILHDIMMFPQDYSRAEIQEVFVLHGLLVMSPEYVARHAL